MPLHGHPQLAATLHERVRAAIGTFRRYQQARGFPRWGQAMVDWQGCMILAITPATAAEAVELGLSHLDRRREREAWTCAHLSIAQALILDGRAHAAVDHLIASFTGVESKGTEPFVGPYGLIRGEPAMRTWLLRELAAREVLTAAARERVIAAAKADMLTDEAFDLLGVDADALGEGQPHIINDF